MLLQFASPGSTVSLESSENLCGRSACDHSCNCLRSCNCQIFVVIFLLYPVVSKRAFSTFDCHTLAEGEEWLRADYNVDCQSDLHRWDRIDATDMLSVAVKQTDQIAASLLSITLKDKRMLCTGSTSTLPYSFWRSIRLAFPSSSCTCSGRISTNFSITSTPTMNHRVSVSAFSSMTTLLNATTGCDLGAYIHVPVTHATANPFSRAGCGCLCLCVQEPVELSKKLVLTSLLIFFKPGTVVQISVAQIVSTVYFALQCFKMPYQWK